MLSAIQDAIVRIPEPLPVKPDFPGSGLAADVVVDTCQKPSHYVGLGVLCGEYIFTCAHYYDPLPIHFADFQIFTVTSVCGGEQGDFALHTASTLDVMVLAPDSPDCNSSDAGPTESAWSLVYGFTDKHPALIPAEISFSTGSRSADVSGFFFAPDGQTICRTVFHITENHPTISFYSKEMKKGCSGGPLITDDMKIIGIATNLSNILDDEGRMSCIGKRIDLCVPVYLHRELKWDMLTLK